jgi:hypothetical protein
LQGAGKSGSSGRGKSRSLATKVSTVREPQKKLSVQQALSPPAGQTGGELILRPERTAGVLNLPHQSTANSLAVFECPEQRIRGSCFPIAIVLLGLLLMLRAATSLRAAAAAIEISEEIYRGRLLAGPAHNTVRNHLLRLGLYEINRAKAVLTDWVWIVDHTIQVGHQLCMVILGIPLSRFQQLGRPLRCEDMQVLELLPMEKSNGEVMGVHFTNLASRYGHPVAVVSDEGSDISGGFQSLCQGESPSIGCIDIVHKISRLIKKILDRDTKWGEYRKQCCATGNRLRQTSLAHLTPPKPKTKARHMNLDPEIQWGVNVLRLLDSIETNENYDAEQRQKLKDSAGWLASFRNELSAWSELMAISRLVCGVVRRKGYDHLIVQHVENALERAKSDLGATLIEQTLAFLQIQQSRCDPSLGKLPGVSEVIESLFGKGKRLEGQQSRSGFTAQLLSMAACVLEPTEELIRAAFASVDTQAVRDWQTAMLGTSVQSRRRRDLSKTPCQKTAQETNQSNPNSAKD